MRKKFPLSIEEDSIDEPLINLTPLIDVVFVILITFMLIAPVLDMDSINLAQSGGMEKKELQTGPISISVHADDSIWYKGTKITLAELATILKKEKKAHPNAIPQILHDKQAHFGTYQALKNTIEAVGFVQMDIILKPG